MSIRTLAASAILAIAVPVAADTTQDFDTAGSAYVLGEHTGTPGASVVAGGPTGNFLRLASGAAAASSLNTIGFDRTDLGASCTVTIDFDFRLTPVVGSADGLGVVLLDTAFHGPDGTLVVSEEANATASLGIGFDIYQNAGDLNDNHISVHHDGALLSEIDASPVDLDGTAGQFIHARIVIDSDATGGSVTVVLTPPASSAVTVVDALPVPALRPYEGRLLFAARTGGQASDHDLDNISATYAACPDVVGEWGDALPTPVIAIHADLLPTGKVLFWDRDDTGAGPGAPHLFDPDTEVVTVASDPGYDLFCSGHSFLPDGTLLVTGGHDGADGFGLPYGTLYDAPSDTWTTVAAEMNAGRWYPTNTTLANGDTLVVTGVIIPWDTNLLPQVFENATSTWRDLSSAMLSVDLYSFLHLAPNGMAVLTGPSTTTRYLDTSGTGSWITVDTTGGAHRSYGSSVMYDHGQTLLIGGGDPPTNTVEVIDFTDPTPEWRFVQSMGYVRRQLNATILADGTVLVTGGTGSNGFNSVEDAVFAAELWNPATETWSTMAGAQIPRIYHSFALLLPDARVLTGGGGHPPGQGPPGDLDHYDVEIFSPPYLFRGPRPEITSAPATFGHGETFLVESPDTDSIGSVHLLRLAAVTHSFNQDQRINHLSFQKTPEGLLVTAPPDGIHAPPGYYMLFILDETDVPSVAPIVQLLPNAGDLPDGGAVPGPLLAVDRLPNQDLSLSWGSSCSGDDFDFAIYEGTLGDFTSHSPVVCTTGGMTTDMFPPGPGSTYYLVVPRNLSSEGSYGRASTGIERPAGLAACLPQSLGACD